MQTALILIDVQQSFAAMPFWSDEEVPAFLERTNTLLAGCARRGIPVVRVFHADPGLPADHPFSPASGQVRPLDGVAPFDAAFQVDKRRHSALAGTPLYKWLQAQGIRRMLVAGIRTEQCCEATARNASDEGWEVDYVSEATLTFDMQTPAGRTLGAADLKERTETVLAGRFATICTVEEALARAA